MRKSHSSRHPPPPGSSSDEDTHHRSTHRHSRADPHHHHHYSSSGSSDDHHGYTRNHRSDNHHTSSHHRARGPARSSAPLDTSHRAATSKQSRRCARLTRLALSYKSRCVSVLILIPQPRPASLLCNRHPALFPRLPDALADRGQAAAAAGNSLRLVECRSLIKCNTAARRSAVSSRLQFTKTS